MQRVTRIVSVVQTLMASRAVLNLIRTIALLIGAFVVIGQASAHADHHAEFAPSLGAVAAAHEEADAAQILSIPGCPGHGGGECCCDEVFAHAPPQQQTLPLAPPLALRLASRFALPRLRVRAAHGVVSLTVPPVIGSRGSRGPPSA
jgi:hypothetical protein